MNKNQIDRSPLFFSGNKLEKRHKVNTKREMYWDARSIHLNDNGTHAFHWRAYFLILISFAYLVGSVLGLQSSAITTELILRSDQRLLSVMMDIHPEALGYLLNNMDIGE